MGYQLVTPRLLLHLSDMDASRLEDDCYLTEAVRLANEDYGAVQDNKIISLAGNYHSWWDKPEHELRSEPKIYFAMFQEHFSSYLKAVRQAFKTGYIADLAFFSYPVRMTL